jgi:FSR family fosmidomycin resistance protein-like MFS transporter
MVRDPMRALLTPRLVLLAAGHFTVDVYSSFFIPLLPLLVARLHLSLTLVGTLVALSSLSSSFSQPFFGLLADRLRRPWLIGLGPICAAAFMSTIGLAPSFWVLVVLVMLGGMGVSWFHPQSAVLATEASPRRSLAMSVFITGGTLGGALGPAISVGVVGLVGLAHSWVAMLPGVVLGVWLLAALARPGGGDPRSGPAREGAASAPGGWKPEAGRGPGAEPGAPLRELRPVLRPLALLYVAVVTRSAVSYGFMTFLPIHLRRLGYTVSFGGWALTAYLAMGALGGFLGGWLAEKIGGRRVVVQSFVGAIPLFLAFLVLPTVPGLVALVVGSFVIQGSLPVNVVLGQELSPRHSSTISSLLMGAAWGVGAMLISPVGVLADHFGIQAALAVLSALLLVGLGCALALPSPHEHAELAEMAHQGARGQ